ncbi:MAG: hypothetical protein RL071_4841 [Pseudomonadota bacterium]
MRPDPLLLPRRPGAPRRSLALLALGVLTACAAGPRTTSRINRVQPRSGEVWARDVGNALGLQPWELCAELGTRDCVEEAHRITLGGVEPASLGIDAPLPEPSVSAPLAADRVAISACGERYARDKAGPAVLFGPVLDRDSRRSREEVSAALVLRMLGRPATEDEVDALEALYDDIKDKADDPVRSWAVGACVVVTTSTEALFY